MATASDAAVIISAARTPLGRFMGELSPFSAHKLGFHVIGAALERGRSCPRTASTKCLWAAYCRRALREPAVA
jgi:acetyl-CoA acetyltransferase